MILNRQRKVKVSLRGLRNFLTEIRKELNLPDNEITIAFVSDAEMARLNEQFRGKKGPTDVLSFPEATASTKNKHAARATSQTRGAGILGDIAIAPQTAKRYAQKNNRSLQDELRVLILHGILHLLGYDHEIDRGRMNRLERRLRRRLGLA